MDVIVISGAFLDDPRQGKEFRRQQRKRLRGAEQGCSGCPSPSPFLILGTIPS